MSRAISRLINCNNIITPQTPQLNTGAIPPKATVRPPVKSKSGADEKDDLLGTFLGQMYLLGHVLGKGSFGTIRLCSSGRPNHFVVAKVEHRRKGKQSRLYDEFGMLREIRGAVGFPKVYYYSELTGYNVMILDMLGPTLVDLMKMVPGQTFTKKTIALIGIQLMDRLEYLHSKRILYRDIKGENLLIGHFDHHNRIYIVDFGLCKHVLKEDGYNYTPVGTPRYMSLRTHSGRASTFRDDVESVGYLLIYFAVGSLPWQGMPAASTDTKIAMIAEKKASTPVTQLCSGLPSQMLEFVQASRNLSFNEFPNYDYFRGLFRGILKSCVSEGERCFFDWQRPNITLKVSPKTTQPTAISQKRQIKENNVIDLRQSGKESPGDKHSDIFGRRRAGDGIKQAGHKCTPTSCMLLKEKLGLRSSLEKLMQGKKVKVQLLAGLLSSHGNRQ